VIQGDPFQRYEIDACHGGELDCTADADGSWMLADAVTVAIGISDAPLELEDLPAYYIAAGVEAEKAQILLRSTGARLSLQERAEAQVEINRQILHWCESRLKHAR
jgi:hypothetical protein